METFSALLAICAGNSPEAQSPETRSFGVFFDLCLNKLLRKQSGGWWFETLSRPLWRHCNEKGYIRVVCLYFAWRSCRVWKFQGLKKGQLLDKITWFLFYLYEIWSVALLTSSFPSCTWITGKNNLRCKTSRIRQNWHFHVFLLAELLAINHDSFKARCRMPTSLLERDQY